MAQELGLHYGPMTKTVFLNNRLLPSLKRNSATTPTASKLTFLVFCVCVGAQSVDWLLLGAVNVGFPCEGPIWHGARTAGQHGGEGQNPVHQLTPITPMKSGLALYRCLPKVSRMGT